MLTRTEQARQERREQILQAALECFGRSGFHATTMAEISVHAGVSKGTPYLYFASKEALFIALDEEWDCRAGARMTEAVQALDEDGRGSPSAVLRAMVIATAEYAAENPQACRVLMEVRALAPYYPAIAEAVRAADTRTLRQVTALITDAIAAGERPAGADPGFEAQLLIAGINGLMAQWHQEPGSFPLAASVAELVDRLIGAGPSGGSR